MGEQEKTIKYRFFDAKELKQGVCRAEQAQATADDYATAAEGREVLRHSLLDGFMPIFFAGCLSVATVGS